MTSQIETLLERANSIVVHQQEIKKLKGESFNIFSILKAESGENATHSAFVGELLNAAGSHLQGTLFLKLFLTGIGYQGALDINTARLTLEKHIGTRNDKTKTGGRIDIYLSDAQGVSVSIENKIDAGDQYAQIERYVTHNKERNVVYYLTKDGNAPSVESCGELKDGSDFFCISYKSTIVHWLEKCLKESADQPILRESIRQYIILVKKITNQLTDHAMETEVNELIKRNYSVAKVISDNIWEVEMRAAHSFLVDVKAQIEKELTGGWTVILDDDLNQAWSGLKITHTNWNGILVKLEGNSKIPWTNSYYGILAPIQQYDRTIINTKLANTNFIKEGFKVSDHWPCYKYILDLGNTEQRARLFNAGVRTELVKDVSQRMIEFAKECQLPLARIEKRTK